MLLVEINKGREWHAAERQRKFDQHIADKQTLVDWVAANPTATVTDFVGFVQAHPEIESYYNQSGLRLRQLFNQGHLQHLVKRSKERESPGHQQQLGLK